MVNDKRCVLCGSKPQEIPHMHAFQPSWPREVVAALRAVDDNQRLKPGAKVCCAHFAPHNQRRFAKKHPSTVPGGLDGRCWSSSPVRAAPKRKMEDQAKSAAATEQALKKARAEIDDLKQQLKALRATASPQTLQIRLDNDTTRATWFALGDASLVAAPRQELLAYVYTDSKRNKKCSQESFFDMLMCLTRCGPVADRSRDHGVCGPADGGKALRRVVGACQTVGQEDGDALATGEAA